MSSIIHYAKKREKINIIKVPKLMWLACQKKSYLICDEIMNFRIFMQPTRGPPLTRKSLTRFPLTRFLAYVRLSGGISVHTVQNFKVLNNFISLRFFHLIWVEYNMNIHK